MKEPIRVLLVEDDPNDAELVLRELRRAGFNPDWHRVDTEAEFLGRLDPKLDIVLSDYEMPTFSGPRALTLLQERQLDVPFIIISGTIGEDIAVEVMRQGAADYLLKDRPTRLGPAVSHALRQSRLRRKAEAELRASERRYRELIENLPVAVYTTDAGGYLTLFNEAAAQLWGRKPELGHDRWTGSLRLFTKDGAPLPLSEGPMARAIATEQAGRGIEAIIERPDGSRVAYLAYPTPLHDADGKMTGAMNVLVDITARKQAEAAIQERLQLEERLSRLMAAAPGIVYSFRLRPDGSTCIPYASPKLEEIVGVRPEQVREDASAAFALIHPDDLALVRASIRDSASTLKQWARVYRVQHPRRGLLWIEGRAKPVREPDGSVLWHGFFLDVTERKQLEEQFRQAQKMEAVGQLAGGVAHDFNNILTIIQGYASLLQETGIDPHEAAQEISHAVDRASALSRQLLAFSRKQVMQPRELDLNGVVTGVAKMLHRTLGEDVALIFEPGRNLPAIHADPGMLEQILMNLSINARHAMPTGGRLVIAAQAVIISESDVQQHPETSAGPGVRLRVSDTGCGIPPEALPRIFEPFFTTKDPGKGTGLGLATVDGIMRQHHGWVAVTSEINRGTTFEMVFPASRGAAAPIAVPEVEQTMIGGSATILFVDDEPELRKVAVIALRHLGYTVLEAATGPQALAVFAENRDRIELLLTDMVMPGGISGTTLAELLQARQPALRVLFTSGYAVELANQELPDTGSIHFLKKPYSTHQLARAVHERLHD